MTTPNNTPVTSRNAELDQAWQRILERLSVDSTPEDRTLAAASMGMILASGNGCSDELLPEVVDALVAAAIESQPGIEAALTAKHEALNSNAVSALEAFVGPSTNVAPSSFARALVTKENMDKVFDRLEVAEVSATITRSCLTYISLATFLTQAETPGVADVAGVIYEQILARDFFGRVVDLVKASADPELRVRAGEVLGAMVSTSEDLKKVAIEMHVAKTLMANISGEKSTYGARDEESGGLGSALAPQVSEEEQQKRKLFQQYHIASDELCLQCIGMVLKEDKESALEIASSPAMVQWLSKLMGMGSPVARLIFQAIGSSEYKEQFIESMRQAQADAEAGLRYTTG